MKFTDFIGNKKAKEQLLLMLESGRIPHAVLLEGAEGIGKRTLARELVLNLFCRSDEERPCRTCAQCRKVLKGIHPDVYAYTAPDRPAAFHVETVRAVRDDAFVKPNEAAYKVYILGNAQSMTVSAQNALLKVLEEPPAYAIFILTVTNKAQMLETVLSRCVPITLEGVESQRAAEYICEKLPDTQYNDALRAAQIWDGNIGKAMESLSDGRLAQISDLANQLAQALLHDHEYEMIKQCAAFQKNKEVLVSTLSLLKSIFRDALIGSTDSVSGQREMAQQLSARLSKDKLIRLMAVCDTIKTLAERNGNNALLITKLSADLRSAVGR